MIVERHPGLRSTLCSWGSAAQRTEVLSIHRPAADVYRGPAVKRHDKIVRFDRDVTLIALGRVHSRHHKCRVHQRCHNRGTLGGELISHEKD